MLTIRQTNINFLFLPVILLFVVGYFPAIELLVHKWWTIDDYTHALFIAPIVIYILWQKRSLFLTQDSGSPSAILFILLSTGCYIFSLSVQVPTFIFLSLILSITSFLLFFGGYQSIPKLAIPILLLLILIPIPNQILSALTGTLQLRISEVSEVIIRLFSVPMFREGNIIHVQQLAFQVVEACSGIRSLISMVTMAVLVSYYTLSRFSSLLILLISAVPIALLINIIRVVVMVVIYHYFKLDLSEGTYHTLLGLFLFVFGLALLFLIQQLLEQWERKKSNN